MDDFKKAIELYNYSRTWMIKSFRRMNYRIEKLGLDKKLMRRYKDRRWDVIKAMRKMDYLLRDVEDNRKLYK